MIFWPFFLHFFLLLLNFYWPSFYRPLVVLAYLCLLGLLSPLSPFSSLSLILKRDEVVKLLIYMINEFPHWKGHCCLIQHVSLSDQQILFCLMLEKLHLNFSFPFCPDMCASFCTSCSYYHWIQRQRDNICTRGFYFWQRRDAGIYSSNNMHSTTSCIYEHPNSFAGNFA